MSMSSFMEVAPGIANLVCLCYGGSVFAVDLDGVDDRRELG
jgi:hypothetical protein